jgi:hypothetical protein
MDGGCDVIDPPPRPPPDHNQVLSLSQGIKVHMYHPRKMTNSDRSITKFFYASVTVGWKAAAFF